MKTNHSIIIQWSDVDKVFIASVPEISGLNAFGDTPEEAIKELNVAKKLLLRAMKEDGELIPDPEVYVQYSGQLRIRIAKSLHASLSQEAKKENISLNTYISHLLSERNAFREVKKELENIKIFYLSQIFNEAQTSGKSILYPFQGSELSVPQARAQYYNNVRKN
jgi:antitoxin HicB